MRYRVEFLDNATTVVHVLHAEARSHAKAFLNGVRTRLAALRRVGARVVDFGPQGRLIYFPNDRLLRGDWDADRRFGLEQRGELEAHSNMALTGSDDSVSSGARLPSTDVNYRTAGPAHTT